MAAALDPLGPQPVTVSPLRRTQETARPLLDRWAVSPVVDPAVGELAPPPDPRPDHVTWLRALMAGTGADHPAVMTPFRSRVLGAIRALRADTVVVTHFLAINAVVGAATGDDRVVCFSPAHCSITTVTLDADGRLALVGRGEDGRSSVRL
jgi:broad specificity phosphatase PhoE